jgi:SAM-dependent methyltransferase
MAAPAQVEQCRFSVPTSGRSLLWEVTRFCNLECKHCCTYSGPKVSTAKAGAVVTGVDSSSAMIGRTERDAHDQGVEVSWIQSDMRSVAWGSVFDCAICLGGSFGYFGRVGDQAFLRTLQEALRPDGCLVLDVPSLEIIRAHHEPVHESVIGGLRVVQHRYLDPTSGVARISVIIETGRGHISRTYYQQLYLTDELRAMLAASSFEVREILDASHVAEFSSNSGHLLVVARCLAS